MLVILVAALAPVLTVPAPASAGSEGGLPYDFVGDWNGDGFDTPAKVQGSISDRLLHWHLRNDNSSGSPEITFTYGNWDGVPVVGDWDGDGDDTPGVVYRRFGQANEWHLRNSNTSGVANVTFRYGGTQERIIAGDWDGDGDDNPGVVDEGVGSASWWYLRTLNSTGVANIQPFAYGDASGLVHPIVGDWDGDGDDTPGLVREFSFFVLRNSNTTGSHDLAFTFGFNRYLGTGYKPVPGDWDRNGSDTPGVAQEFADLQGRPTFVNYQLSNLNQTGTWSANFDLFL